MCVADFELPIGVFGYQRLRETNPRRSFSGRISLDGRFLSQWVRTGDKSWGEFNA